VEQWNTAEFGRTNKIMRIPLPVFYVAEAKDGRIIVVVVYSG
jgi:hypothetical protein